MHGLQWDYSFPRSPHGSGAYSIDGFKLAGLLLQGTVNLSGLAEGVKFEFENIVV
jgi:hypothetical protein